MPDIADFYREILLHLVELLYEQEYLFEEERIFMKDQLMKEKSRKDGGKTWKG
ncbi:MAG: hypothetical protein J6B26_04880 [Agathobacter sp.]|nr:hypothetical protein [Agathobacter sp.]